MNVRLFVALILIFFITPQTSITYYNYVVETINSTGIFLNYADVKKFVFRFTWFCIFVFIFLNCLSSFFFF